MNFEMSITTTRLTLVLALLIGTMSIAHAADDEILKRLDAIEGRLNKIEKSLAETKTAKEVNPADVFKEISKALAGGREERNKKFEAEKLIRQKKEQEKIEREVLKRAEANKYLSIVKWEAREGIRTPGFPDSINFVAIFYTMKNESSKKISVIDGSFIFEDKLGDLIAKIKIEKDVNLLPSEERVFGVKRSSYDSGAKDVGRLRFIEKSLVNIHLDIDRILFEDGAVVEF